MAAGFHCRTLAIHCGLSARKTGMENMTPEAYIQVRITNGISWARSGVFMAKPARTPAPDRC